MARTLRAAIVVVSCFACGSSAPTSINLDGGTALHVYDGHGALSAGASSRLLWDYPEPQRSEILDYLFKPNWGASLHLLKVEIGGDGQSTDGTEPSPAHTRDDWNCSRGYEPWLLLEAKKRNPDILTYGLSWAVPHWIGNGSFFSDDNLAYQSRWARCVGDLMGQPLDYIGVWNERSWGSVDYVVGLRNALDAAGASAEIILPDGGSDIPGIISAAQQNATFNSAISGVGLHYPCHDPVPIIQEGLHKKFWASEDYSTVYDWAGAACWGRLLVDNYVRMNQTSTISWSLIWSVYPNLPYGGNGLMRADEPWSGHYSGGGTTTGLDPTPDLMNGPIWTSAHFTQFTQPGWKFLTVNGGGSGTLPGGGSFATLVGANGVTQFTVVITTLEGDCLRCKGPSTTAQDLVFHIVPGSGLPPPGTVLAVWRTTQAAQFVSSPGVTVAADGSFAISIGADELVTVSTITTAAKGSFGAVPPAAPFPMPYADDFDSYAYDAMARYWSDQAGSFAVRNGSLMQVVPVNDGSDGWVVDTNPVTLLGGGAGDAGWQNYTVGVTVLFSSAAPPTADPSAMLAPCASASAQQAWAQGAVASGYLSNTPGGDVASQLCLNLGGCGADAIYYSCLTTGGTCCGAQCYDGLKWTTPAAGTPGPIKSPLAGMGGQCLTAVSNTSLVMTSCGGAGQTWEWTGSGSPATGAQLQLSGSGMCLSTTPSLGATYAQVCGRISAYSGFDKVPPGGYCLALTDAGTWFLRAGAVTLTSGSLGPGFNSSTTPVRLTLTMVGTSITAAFTPVGSTGAGGAVTVPDPTYSGGMSALGSGFHAAAFDDYSLAPAS
jgi:galactosylceramidase